MTTDRQRWPLEEAASVANEILAQFTPATERVAIAGSVRRQKSTVGDIELLYVPKFSVLPKPDDLFTTERVNLAEIVVANLLSRGVLAKRKNSLGQESWGHKNKFAVHCQTGIPVDLFATIEENWWVSLVIRTGSKEMNLRLTTEARTRHRTLNAYGAGVTIWATGEIVPAHSEEEVFELCGVPYLVPERRT